MSGRFVSGGTISAPGAGDTAAATRPEDRSSVDDNASAEEVEAAAAAREMLPGAKKNRAEWEAVRQELEEDRRRREAQRAGGGQEQSLYDILQANKAAKQAAFEEQNKLKNQFRPLDDDEVHFLDEVMAKERDEEERLKRETEEGLRVFRLRQKSGGGVADDDDAAQTAESAEQHEDDNAVEDWAALGGRKRKRVGREGQVVKGVKRKSHPAEEKRTGGQDEGKKRVKIEEERSGTAGVEQKKEKKRSLVAYDSDEDD